MPYFKGISANLWQQWQQFHEKQNCLYARISYVIYTTGIPFKGVWFTYTKLKKRLIISP
jgi:hypothetical protein